MSEDESAEQTGCKRFKGLCLEYQALEDRCTGVCDSSVVVIVDMNFKVHRTFLLALFALPLE